MIRRPFLGGILPSLSVSVSTIIPYKPHPKVSEIWIYTKRTQAVKQCPKRETDDQSYKDHLNVTVDWFTTEYLDLKLFYLEEGVQEYFIGR